MAKDIPIVLSKAELTELLREAVNTTPPDKAASLSHEELEDVVSRAVRKTLEAFGFDSKNPLAVQKDMAFIRSMRIGTAKVKMAAILSFVGTICTAIATLLWLGYKALKQH